MNKKYLTQDIERKTPKDIIYLDDKQGIFNNDDKLFLKLKNLDFTLRIEEAKYLNLILSHIFKQKI